MYNENGCYGEKLYEYFCIYHAINTSLNFKNFKLRNPTIYDTTLTMTFFDREIEIRDKFDIRISRPSQAFVLWSPGSWRACALMASGQSVVGRRATSSDIRARSRLTSSMRHVYSRDAKRVLFCALARFHRSVLVYTSPDIFTNRYRFDTWYRGSIKWRTVGREFVDKS